MTGDVRLEPRLQGASQTLLILDRNVWTRIGVEVARLVLRDDAGRAADAELGSRVGGVDRVATQVECLLGGLRILR